MRHLEDYNYLKETADNLNKNNRKILESMAILLHINTTTPLRSIGIEMHMSNFEDIYKKAKQVLLDTTKLLASLQTKYNHKLVAIAKDNVKRVLEYKPNAVWYCKDEISSFIYEAISALETLTSELYDYIYYNYEM